MHGVIFSELNKYAQARLGADGWKNLLAEAGLTGKVYLGIQTYPDEEAVKLVGAATKLAKADAATILEDFGGFIAPDLLEMYGMLARPEWRTLEFLENVERTIHRVVRLRQPGAAPPEIRTTRTSKDEVAIDYSSARRMCALARGLIRGVSEHYKQKVTISEPECMLKSASRCRIVVRLDG